MFVHDVQVCCGCDLVYTLTLYTTVYDCIRTTFHMTVQPLVMMAFVLQNGYSPLHAASEDGHLDVVETLLKAGANINQAMKVQ